MTQPLRKLSPHVPARPAELPSRPDGKPWNVVVGIPSRGECKSHFARSLADLGMWDSMLGRGWLWHEKPFIWVIGGTIIANTRNTLCHRFLAETDADVLVMIDDDQQFPPELLEFLVEPLSEDRPVIAVPVWRFASENDGPVRVTHNVFDLDDQGRFAEYQDLPAGALVQVPAVGTGCIAFHRSALERIRIWSEANGNGRRWCWFRHNVYPGDANEGEDVYFGRVAAAAGVPIFVNTSITLDHLKTVVLNGPVPEGLVAI